MMIFLPKQGKIISAEQSALFSNPKKDSKRSNLARNYQLKCANALFASAILCVSVFFLMA